VPTTKERTLLPVESPLIGHQPRRRSRRRVRLRLLAEEIKKMALTVEVSSLPNGLAHPLQRRWWKLEVVVMEMNKAPVVSLLEESWSPVGQEGHPHQHDEMVAMVIIKAAKAT